MATGSYVGNAPVDDRGITGLGFRPHVVIIKGNNSVSGVLRSSTMSGDLSKPLVGDTALAANLVQSLDADGFTIGSDSRVNQSGITFYWAAFEADADLAVGMYTGNGGTQSIATLGFSPEYLIVMSSGGRRAVQAHSQTPVGRSYEFLSAAKLLSQITTLDPSGFSVNHSAPAPYVNESAVVYHYVAWNDVPLKTKVGSYPGNGMDNRSIPGVGFQPEYLIVKAIYDNNVLPALTPPPHQRMAGMPVSPATSDTDFNSVLVTDHIQAFEVDGFQIGAAQSTNRTFVDCNIDGPGCTYFYVAFNLVAPDCPPLTTTQGAGTITVSALNSFEMTFSTSAGGSIETFYDLAEDPGKTSDLAGAIDVDGLTSSGMTVLPGPVNYNSTFSNSDSKLDLLEATPTRVRVRQEAFYASSTGVKLAGVKGLGDFSVYPTGRMAYRWNRRTTSAVTYETEYMELVVHRTGAAPLNTWNMYSETDGVPNNPGTDNFLLAQNEVPGARTDFLDVIYRDWVPANGHLGTADITGWSFSAPNQRFNAYWDDLTAGTTIPANASENWDFLIHFKPTNFANNADPLVTSRSADHRGPSALAVTVGGPWLSASENTGGGDDFNEAEAAYPLTLDPALGLTFRIDGSVATPRYHPFFKIREWRSLAGPPSVTLQGTPLVAGVDYRADVKPVSRAHFAQALAWHSTLESAADVTTPDIGGAGTVNGATSFMAGKYGSAALFNAAGANVTFSSGVGNFDKTRGALEFWYRPNYAHTDGVRHVLWQTFGDATHTFVFEKTVGNQLLFSINNGGTLTEVLVAPTNYIWSANEWVHLRATWDATAVPLANQVHVLVNQVEPPHTGPAFAYDDVTMTVGTNYIGSDSTGTFSASGLIDEFHMYSGPVAPTTPAPLAEGGLTSNANEFLADGSKNSVLAFAGVGASGQGRYLYMGADSQFRGLNVGLATLGAGVAADDLDWEYWDGTNWVSMESGFGFIDLTSSFTRTGNVYWTDLFNWSPYSVNGGPDLYYLRVHLKTSATYAPPPQEGLIKTDILLFQFCGDITAAAQQFVFGPPIPTAVTLSSFTAAPADGAVDLSWTTASELQNLGFHLYRADSAGGPYTRITSSLIPGLGSSPTGQSYSYRDGGLVNGRTYYYELEDIETTGRAERHAPVSATPGTAAPGPPCCTPPPTPPPSPSGTSYGDPSSVVLREVERSPRHVVLELQTGGFYASPMEGGRVRLTIPGFESASRPGEPELPMRRALVEAAAGRKVRLATVLASDVLRFPGLRPESQGSPGIEVSEDGMVLPSQEATREGPAFRRLFPSESARLEGTSFQRETKKAEVLLFPLRWDGSGLLLSRRLLVRLVFEGREGRETSRGGSLGRQKVQRSSHTRRGVVAQFLAKERGLYRVDYEDIFPTSSLPGRSRRGISASSLQLSRQGERVAFHVEPPGAVFGLGSSLYFLSEGSSLNPYGDAVYELETNASGLLMGVETLSTTSRVVVAEYFETREKEENRYYQAGLLEAPDLWLWDIVVSPGSKSYAFTVDQLAGSSSSAGRLSVTLQGASDFEGILDHHVRVRVNGSFVGETSWDGRLPKTLEMEVSAGVLQEGENTLEIEDVGDAGASYSMVFLNRFSLSYPRRLVAVQGKLEGSFGSSGQAEIEGLGASSFLLDTTDIPHWLTGASATPIGLSFPVQAGRSYLLTSTFLRPEVKRLEPSGLKSVTNRADYLLLAPRAFLEVAQPLLGLRESQGLVTQAVSLEEVFEQFGHGEVSPEAIKEFLEYAYHFWTSPSPRYVLLLGDASYDPKDYLKTEVKNWLPGFPVRTSYLWTVSDPAYASVNGEDLLPDLAIGRLPAGSVDEAQRLVQKVLAFENGGGNFDGPAVLVADNADLAGNFEADADEIASTILASRSPTKIYYSQEGANTRTRIEEAFDAGASLMSYMGHGGTVVWASENIFNYQDVQTLAPQPQQPLLMTMNCLNGFFHFPPLNSLSEELLKAEGKGVIGAFSPSGLSVNDPAHLFHKAVLQEILSGQHERLGDAILAAQEAYAQTGAFPELLSIYHLFGDPALRIR